MKVFLDFEASSLSDRSYPVEVAWVLEDGGSESHLIAPATDWDDWDPVAQSIHGIAREQLVRDGTPHDRVAHRMVEALTGHDLFASAPSWDGKWLSHLLRTAGLPRHSLRLRDTDEALRDSCTAILQPVLDPARLKIEVHNIVARASAAKTATPAHRALADAMGEHDTWRRAEQAARALAARMADG
ncbi:transcriptional regulator [Sphingomonas sp. KR1UV-12]|uniref:Transcriptional regulator n=1 Tax=Sphingomonas aurea TaxID=3063994 RepID=A0ABT9ENT9_9SPHN|nr:transcriptional regulator [Sphingomonas sp. KR1UV-12]MDP1028453.1 transcriptional regulator [Sphingomonas sp. KR1UV-12]